MIVAGIGCGRDTAATEIVALIYAVMENFNIARAELAAIATEVSKADEFGLEAASLTLAVPLLRYSIAELDAVEERLLTRSKRVMAVKGTTSIAEAAALVGAGRNARLLGARVSAGRVTCAIAEGEGA